MPGRRVIKQGEHVPRIAAEAGFIDFKTIWDHAQNARLKELRQNPCVLNPGDILFVPETEQRQESRATTHTHRFVRQKQTIMLRLKVQDLLGQPIPPGSRCRLKVERERYSLTLGGEGLVEQEIPIAAENGSLEVHAQQAGANGEVATRTLAFTLKIGHLDPVEEDSGMRARLNNMGYMAGFSQTDEKQLKWAVEEFQCDNDMEVNGQSDDPATQAMLKQVHGC